MNRTFFGDTRDLFKYDLVRHIMKAMSAFDSFTFVPMLSDDAEAKGGKKSTSRDLNKAVKAGKAGSQNKDLLISMERLQEIESDLEYFRTIEEYFRKENILIDIIHKHPFTHKGRGEYFRNVLSRVPKKTLLFLDPDTGLEESAPTKKHLLYDEVKKIAGAMDSVTVLMIYQHFPREKHQGFVRRRCRELHATTGLHPISITDNEVVFFCMVKDPRVRAVLDDVLDRYANSYPVLESCSCR